MAKKLKITDLLAQKEAIKNARKAKERRDIYIDELDSIITIEQPDQSAVLDALELGQDEDFEGNADSLLVYEMVVEPNLKDDELQKEFGCVEPTDIVEMLFKPGTITFIAKEGIDMAGYNNKSKVVGSELKN